MKADKIKRVTRMMWNSVKPQIRSIMLMCGLLVINLSSHAQKLKLVDQHGAPIKDAVVAIAQHSATDSANLPVAIMDQINKQFVPKVLTISAGQKVSFPNSDDIRHHVYSFSTTRPFEIKLFKGLVTEPILFDKPGIVVLGCNIHDQMVAYIYVAKDELTFISDEQGEVELPDSESTISIWHANLSTQNTKRESIDISQLRQSAGDGSLSLTIPLIVPKQGIETEEKNSSKFKKKFN